MNMREKAAWPVYDDGELVHIGDEAILPYRVAKIKVHTITFGSARPELGCHVNGFWVGSDERCKRPEKYEANGYQTMCLRTCPTNPTTEADKTLDMCAMGVTGEAGEFADLLKKIRYQGHEFDREHLIKELGDVMYYVAVAALALNARLTDVMEANVDKLKKRYPDGFSVDRSVNREEGDV